MGVAFHPKVLDYLIGVSYSGKVVLVKINSSDYTMV
jgi:hypothetical protein